MFGVGMGTARSSTSCSICIRQDGGLDIRQIDLKLFLAKYGGGFMKKWIVCADRVGAVVYDWKKGVNSLTEITRLVHPKGSSSSRDLVSDKPGRTLNRANSARNVLVPKNEATEIELHKFAKTIGEFLEEAGYNKKFDSLTLSAEPHTLGVIKKELGQHSSTSSTKFLNYELTKLSIAELKDFLAVNDV